MKVVLLCAGRSKRLKPVEDKNLLKFMGEPLVKLRMESLARFGLTEFIIVAGEHNLEALQKITYALPYEIEFVKQENLDEGMAGAIKSAQDVIDNNPILVVSTNDSVENKLIERLKNAVEKEDPEALIVGKQVEKYFPGGYLQVDENGHLTRIIEKPGPGNEPSNMINLVYHYFKEPDKLVTKLEKTKSSSDDIYEVATKSDR